MKSLVALIVAVALATVSLPAIAGDNENRAYTAVSSIMKTKHDTVKNSIGNIR
jgi:hypothetical protein